MANSTDHTFPAIAARMTPTEALTRFTLPAGTLRIAAPVVKEESVFGFRVGQWGFLVATGVFCEVMGQFRVDPLPNTPPWFMGLLNLRGNLVPAFDLRPLLGETGADRKKRSLLVIGAGERAIGLWIDGFPEVMAAFTAPPGTAPDLPDLLHPHLVEAHSRAGQFWLEVRFDPLFEALGRRLASGWAP